MVSALIALLIFLHGSRRRRATWFRDKNFLRSEWSDDYRDGPIPYLYDEYIRAEMIYLRVRDRAGKRKKVRLIMSGKKKQLLIDAIWKKDNSPITLTCGKLSKVVILFEAGNNLPKRSITQKRSKKEKPSMHEIVDDLNRMFRLVLI